MAWHRPNDHTLLPPRPNAHTREAPDRNGLLGNPDRMATSDALRKAIARSQAQVVAKAAAAKAKGQKPIAITGTSQSANENTQIDKPDTDLLKPASPKPAATRRKGKQPAKAGKDRKSDQIPLLSVGALDEDQALWRLFQLPDHPPEVRCLVAPRLPGILKGLLEGASKPGLQGAGDRTTFGKMMGATWAKPAAAQAGDNLTAAQAIGDRISRAIARREAGFRPQSVTLDADTGLELAEDLPFRDTARMLGEQVRSPEPSTRSIQEGSPRQKPVEGEDIDLGDLTRW